MRPVLFLLGLTLASTQAAPLPVPDAGRLPRWRGFNLLEKFHFSGKHEPFREDDFKLIARLGFNFVRLPMDYRGYIADGDWNRFDEAPLKQIDEAVTWGRKHGIHVCLNLHRAPGWTVAKPPEPKSLWTDPDARQATVRHWAMFARRFRGVPNANLSFNLFNEPAGVPEESYLSVVREVVAAIRAEDPERLVLCDGLEWGTRPVPAMIPLKVGMMTRGYSPFPLTHYRAGWVGGSDRWDVPKWPEMAGTGGTLIVTLRWAEDCLRNWQEAGWGWALWNFRGSFGILDSGRADVTYEDFEGHKLDRKLLDLLQRY